MRLVRQAVAAIGLLLFALTASASPAEPKDNKDYLTLPEVRQGNAGDKVEVIEFFSYACPHCNAFEPSLSAWVKKQGGTIAFRRVPLAFHPQWVPLQKLYLSLEALGKADELHEKVFAAVHKERMPYSSDDAVVEIAVKLGLDRNQFLGIYNSFAVQTRQRSVAHLQDDYKVTGVPLLAVGGRYETSAGILDDNGLHLPEPELFTAALQVADFLVARSAKK
jgi:thiol:disulfide interchange protein DsbA